MCRYYQAADIWAFGILLMEMATGHAPYANFSLTNIIIMTMHSPVPELERSSYSDVILYTQHVNHNRQRISICDVCCCTYHVSIVFLCVSTKHHALSSNATFVCCRHSLILSCSLAWVLKFRYCISYQSHVHVLFHPTQRPTHILTLFSVSLSSCLHVCLT